jgi:hypothetical protein
LGTTELDAERVGMVPSVDEAFFELAATPLWARVLLASAAALLPACALLAADCEWLARDGECVWFARACVLFADICTLALLPVEIVRCAGAAARGILGAL